MDLSSTQTLIDAFNVVAAEVQSLSDRKTILEHKLRFAHEQYSALASRYAPNVPDVAQTLAKLQFIPEGDEKALLSTSYVPLPRRDHANSSQAELAMRIQEGRKAVQQLTGTRRASGSVMKSTNQSIPATPMTALEQDFTIVGKESDLRCPFSQPRPLETLDVTTSRERTTDVADARSRHGKADPICAAMLGETTDSTPQEATAPAASKCPIRYLDKHTPEEIAHYVETHKHDLPRSHAICLRRNQNNEEQIRRLDAKYGNLVSMIQDLSQLHVPMLPSNGQARISGDEEAEREAMEESSARVEGWAQAISASRGTDADEAATDSSEEDDEQEDAANEGRVTYFERPLKEIRVGESPSRPWGISVPIYHEELEEKDERPASPLEPRPNNLDAKKDIANVAPAASKCPFDHSKFATRPHSDARTMSERPAIAGKGHPAASQTGEVLTTLDVPPSPSKPDTLDHASVKDQVFPITSPSPQTFPHPPPRAAAADQRQPSDWYDKVAAPLQATTITSQGELSSYQSQGQTNEVFISVNAEDGELCQQIRLELGKSPEQPPRLTHMLNPRTGKLRPVDASEVSTRSDSGTFRSISRFEADSRRHDRQPPPQMVFTGPVLMGYSVEDATRLIGNLMERAQGTS